MSNDLDIKTEINNIDLWNAATPISKQATKAFKRSGGFSGTAINATYLFKRATEIFGPAGKGWGWEVAKEKVLVTFAGTKDETHIHYVLIKFWYSLEDTEFWEEGDSARHYIETFGQTTLAGSNKYGPYTDEEAPKKSLTDAITKALSILGFASEIHMGLWDDNKYVRQEAPPMTQTAPLPANTKVASEAALQPLRDQADRYIQELWNAKDIGKFQQIAKAMKPTMDLMKDVSPDDYAKYRETVADIHQKTIALTNEGENDNE